ncbi:M23 family metallopeptidase [Undibacter mobilis]|uniref:M23 family peptidase n=1 Tax=Undibacter mobilis TaxID=2292256 RepID=A0A371BE41_9BRAD|nr:M23 family metallopeptidase [Undibacter mobilis]RDV05876.1 M23 family peptidase [Undibacter mobilis]
MSQVAYSQYDHPGQSRTPSAESVSRHLHRAHAANKGHAHDYTLVHHGRQVRVGPVAFWIVVGTLVIMGVWSIATGTYFAFRDDVLTGLIGRQASMQFAYEDRIAELRGQIDRITSRQLLDQEQFDQKVQALLRRQQLLEQRTAAIAGDVVTTGSIKPARVPELRNAPVKPSPISDTVIFTAPPDREARLQSREGTSGNTRLADAANSAGMDGMLARVSLSLDRIDRKQTATLTDMEEKADSKARAIGGVLSDLGISVPKVSPAAPSATGGPYIPLKAPKGDTSAFARQLYRINVAHAQIDRYMRTLTNVPVRKPVVGSMDMSSPFGSRMDPFLRGPAIHTGIDLRGDTGDPVRATASGRVVTASWQGGYGNMVEIDHGNGLSTRYGHMSKIEVKVGQQVAIGQTIGRIGSTGRSTGPHLHYETRIDERPVDPQKFLRAGLRLGSGVLGSNI